MNLPEIIVMANLASIGLLSLAIIQYVKASIPEKIIPYANIGAGIIVSFLFFYKTPIGSIDWVQVIANGILGAVLADTGYKFASGTNSPPFSLASKGQINGGNKK